LSEKLIGTFQEFLEDKMGAGRMQKTAKTTNPQFFIWATKQNFPIFQCG
jgi:hypothetical protein